MGSWDSGSGLLCPSPARLRRLLTPPPARSRKVPKRCPNVRKRNFLFPTLERAALRWLRGDLGTSFPPRRARRLSRVGEVGWTRRLPPRPPFRTQLFSFNRPSFPSAPLFSANLLLLKGPRFPSPARVGGRGATGLTPLPLGLSPLSSPPSPPPGSSGWTLRRGALGGGVPAAPCPSTPSESGPGRGRGRGKGAGRRCSNLFPSPGGGCGSAPVCGCVPRPAHPPRPPSARWVGAALKGLGAGLRSFGKALGDWD